MQLFDLPRKTYFKLLDDDAIYWFSHLDGMYSFCLDSEGGVLHFAAWTPVEIVPEADVPESFKGKP